MATVYNAPKPRYSSWTWFKFIAGSALPPVLLWNVIKFGANKLLGKSVGKLVLLAQNKNFNHLAVIDDSVHCYNEHDLTCEKYQVITHDQAHLDTFEVKHKSQESIEPKYKQYIINLVGNATCYEHIIDDMKADAKEFKANVVGFNLRGVGQSTGKAKSKDDLVTDGIAQVQRLLDQGISPKNIMLKGHSLGAAVASLVAQHFHQLGQPINIFNSRSFSTLTNVLVGQITLKRNEDGEAFGNKSSIGGKILGWLAKPFLKFALAVTKWEMNAGSAFKNIPQAYRDYIVVRSRKILRDHRIDDAVIPYSASIHQYGTLSSERHEKKAVINKKIKLLRDQMRKTHDLHFKSELAGQQALLIKAKEDIKARKMETVSPFENGHNSNWNLLHNRSGQSAHAFFSAFYQRAAQDHAEKITPKIS